MVSPLALSVLSEVQDLIDRFGAYAGFASVLGLALLTLLYIAQARELKRLREWAGQMPERVGDLQGRITPAAPGRAAPAAASAPRGDQPATPAAQAAHTQTAPLKIVPAATAAAAVAAASSESEKKPADKTPAAPGPLVPGKTGADGSKVAEADPTAIETPARPINPLERAQKPQTARAAGAPSAPSGRGRGPVVGAAIAAAAVVAAVVYFVVGSGDDATTQKRSSKPKAVVETTGKTTSTKAASNAANSKTSVFVLNGTTINGLARGLANSLEQDGFSIKGTDTAADQTRAATLVLFAPGKREEALKVATAIKKGADVVQPVDPGSAALSQNASVVIVVGADQNVTNPG